MPRLSRLFTVCAVITLIFASGANAFETRAQAAYVIDQETKTVLLAKQENVALPPASMSKLMTLFMAFEAIHDGRLKWKEKLPVSPHAMSYGGSSMFLDTTDKITVEDLIRGIIVLSGNDACAVIAEALSVDGTETGFAAMMTERAKAIGMTQSVFANSNGWPHPKQRMSMKDLATLASRLISDFPAEYVLFAEKEFAFDGRVPSNTLNRNPLLSLGIGADGLKTGHTSEAGYGLVGSAKQGGRRVIFVLTGLQSAKDRANEAEKMVMWAFRQFRHQTLKRPDKVLAQARVWMGSSQTVGLTLVGEPKLLVPTIGVKGISSKIVYQGPLQAPIKKGDLVAELVVKIPGLSDARLPLIAAETIMRGGFFPRLRTAAQVLVLKLSGGGAADK